MIIQATLYGTTKEEPFAFTYSGDFTDERVDGIGDVTLNTSGTLTVLSGKATVSVYILAAGGGGAYYSLYGASSGGGGGKQTVEVELVPGTYEIVIGTGGARLNESTGAAGTGGSTTAFGITSTGGIGGSISTSGGIAGAGGTPNGNSGAVGTWTASGGFNASGGSPNGGSVVRNVSQPGGDGLVRITFS